jgi:SNF2 family DNA or RNA helicase
MCTNILINEGYDLDSNNEIKTEIISLEQLNTNMIAKFNEQLKQIINNENRITHQNELLSNRLNEWDAIDTHTETLQLNDKIDNQILLELFNNFGAIEKFNVRNNLEIIYNILDMYMAYKVAHGAGLVLFTNLMDLKNSFVRIWKPTWETLDAMNKVAQYGSKHAKTKVKMEIDSNKRKLETIGNDKKRINNQIALFSNNEFLKEKTSDPCIICFEELKDVVVTPCRHVFCLNCTKQLSHEMKHAFNCPECRTPVKCESLNINTVDIINGAQLSKPKESEATNTPKKMTKIESKLGVDWKNKCTNKYGSKMTSLVEYLHNLFEVPQNRVIIFSQYDKMLHMIGKTLNEFAINYVYCHGNNYVLNKNINKFKKDDSIRVIMLSSETSNSGSNLTEANHIIFIDVLHQDQVNVKATEAQAIGRAVRLGQKLPVKVVRFITRGTIEEEHFTKNRYDMNTLQE